MQSPFLLENESAYQAWRSRKLEGYPTRLEQVLVEINDPRSLTQPEYQAILQVCQKTNMAVYASKTGTDPDKDIPRLLG